MEKRLKLSPFRLQWIVQKSLTFNTANQNSKRRFSSPIKEKELLLLGTKSSTCVLAGIQTKEEYLGVGQHFITSSYHPDKYRIALQLESFLGRLALLCRLLVFKASFWRLLVRNLSPPFLYFGFHEVEKSHFFFPFIHSFYLLCVFVLDPVVGCTKLKDTEWISRQDPYVCLEYASAKFRTRTCTGWLFSSDLNYKVNRELNWPCSFHFFFF